MKVAVVTDTNSGMTREQCPEGLFLMPMPVIVEGKPYLEGVDLTDQQLYQAMREHKEISSSQPAPGTVLELWDRLLGMGYDELIYIPMSSGLSTSCQNAIRFAEEYDGKVEVADNHRISVSQRESALTAHTLAQRGCSARDIKAYLEERALDASIYITVDSMEYLKKSGRATPAAAAFATVLNLKPVLTIQGDKLDAFAKVRGMKQAEARMIEAVKRDRAERFGNVPDEGLEIWTAGTFETPEGAEQWRQRVQEEFPWTQVRYDRLPCSIACHVGRGSAGAGVIQKELA